MKTDKMYEPPIRNMPVEERPYEKCWIYGEKALSDAELFSIILRVGVSGESALELSRRILAFLGADGLSGLYHSSFEQLMQIRGVGKVKAIQLKCIAELSRRIVRAGIRQEDVRFQDPQMMAQYYMEELRHEEQEKVLLLMLDSAGRLMGDEVISTGTVNRSLLEPRDLFIRALRSRSVDIALVHNHPSGDPTPSREDIEITKCIREGGQLLGIRLRDHIIIGDQEAYSFFEHGLL